MNLDQYLKLASSPTLTTLSESVGISKGRLSQLRRSTDWPPDLAMRVEQETGGVVDASHISKIVAKARKTGVRL